MKTSKNTLYAAIDRHHRAIQTFGDYVEIAPENSAAGLRDSGTALRGLMHAGYWKNVPAATIATAKRLVDRSAALLADVAGEQARAAASRQARIARA